MEATGGQGVQLSLCNTWTESMLFIGNLVKVTPKVGKIVPVRGWKRGPAPPRLHTGWRRAGSESAQVFFIITLLGREAQSPGVGRGPACEQRGAGGNASEGQLVSHRPDGAPVGRRLCHSHVGLRAGRPAWRPAGPGQQLVH